MGSLTSAGGGTLNGVVPVAIAMGIAAAVFAVAGWLETVAVWFYSVLGIVAFIPTAAQFVRSDGCLPGPPPALRFAVVALLIAITLVTFFASALTMPRMTALSMGLSLFAALEILVAGAILVSGAGTSHNALVAVALIPASAVLGWAVVRAGEVVQAVGAAALGMQAIFAAAVVAPGCGDANYSGAVLIVVFIGAYFATRAVCAPFTGRHR